MSVTLDAFTEFTGLTTELVEIVNHLLDLNSSDNESIKELTSERDDAVAKMHSLADEANNSDSDAAKAIKEATVSLAQSVKTLSDKAAAATPPTPAQVAVVQAVSAAATPAQ